MTPASSDREPTRLSVNLNAATAAALQELATRHGRTYTDEVHRMIGLAKFIDDELEQNHVIQVVDKDANEVRELVIR